MSIDINLYTEQLEKAVESEIDCIKKTVQENKEKNPNELRKAGLSVFPCKLVNQSKMDFPKLQVETSFPINNTFFKRGVTVLIRYANRELKAKIFDIEQNSIVLHLYDEFEENSHENTLRIDYYPDDRTLECMRLGVKFLKEKLELQNLANDFFSQHSTSATNNTKLNPAQQNALWAILSDTPTALIQGPPGTGKTHTLSIAIDELVKQGKKVVVSAPSNTAVDNLCRKIIYQNNKVKLLRIGNEEKIHESILDYTAEAKIEQSSFGEQMRSLNKQLSKAQQSASKHIRNYTKEVASEKQMARNEVKQLQREIRQLSSAMEIESIENASVIAGTPVGLFNTLNKDFKADVVLIDEAGQALAPLVWLAAVFGKKLVLCGDPQQLPPVVKSTLAKKSGLGMSLLEHCMTVVNPVLLEEQYRIPPRVLSYCNNYFYEGKLKSNSQVLNGNIFFIDTAGFGEHEEENEETGSILNKTEVQLIQKIIENEKLLPDNSVILAPYSAQIDLLKKEIPQNWRISTIDSIQGQEEENILISLTRSNEHQEIGFLSDYRRTNVAITRAKKTCYLIGDSSTIGVDNFYAGLLEYIEKNETYKSAWEYEF